MTISESRKKRILFLCGYNSIRSQMAEGLMRYEFGDRYEVFSAGVASGGVSPHAVAVMQEIGIDISHQRSKTLYDFYDQHFDVVVTLCDHGKGACASRMPKGDVILHKNFTDPDEVEPSEEKMLEEFRTVRDQIRTWLVEQFG